MGQGQVKSGHLRSNFKATILHKKCLSYAECRGKSNGVLGFALGNIVRRKIDFENFTSSISDVFLRHSGIKSQAIGLIFGMEVVDT